jgi:hypothetical protein
MHLINLENLTLYNSELQKKIQQQIQESYSNYEAIVQKDSISDFPEVGNEKVLYVAISTNELYRWSNENKEYSPLNSGESSWHFISTTYSNYSKLSEKYENTLYFLDNGQLYHGDELVSNVKVIQGDFPSVIDSSMYNNFYISLSNGEIRYAGEDGYVNISELATQNIVLSEKNIKILAERVAEKKTVTMPKLEVVGNAVVWTTSNVEEIEVLVPLND